MIVKNGRFGKFAACPNYPTCKSTRPLTDPVKNPAEAAPTGMKCELCGADMVLRSGRYGSFYACSRYPECKFTKQKTKEIGVPCPKCGGQIVMKNGRNRAVFYSCEKLPEVRFFLVGYADQGKMPAVRWNAVPQEGEAAAGLPCGGMRLLAPV
ncbi:MAG: topoisomerase DNA-binding C4 zinc finger domain-containing protein [Oscillospiraceae bacterium]|nr:MAG: topoisomerase DNA-binding C4 zinc finger domain-containing protein [Oscillospiraceae bacterium]